MPSSSHINGSLPADVKVILFDVFGTVVNVTDSLASSLETSAEQALSSSSSSGIPEATRSKALSMDAAAWSAVALSWRENYHHFVQQWLTGDYLAAGTTKYRSVDEENAKFLTRALHRHRLEGLFGSEDGQQTKDVCNSWHKLKAYSDSAEALELLKKKYKVCSLSDGNEALLKNMAAYNGLGWDRVFGGDSFGAYKPSPRIYLGAAKALGVEPRQCALVAAHLQDARAAWECGYRVIYVKRGKEERVKPEEVEAVRKAGWVDVWVDEPEGSQGLKDAAKALGCI